MTATAASLEAQAKINFLLRILAREETGYHQLETLFARIELADSVRCFTATSGREVIVEGADVGPMEQNLAYRAAVAFTEATGWPTGFRIEIEKRIPMGGGLGGGSADAGAVLRILNKLSPAPLPSSQLMTLALRLGADVPFLTGDSTLALAWGRGERMLSLPPLPAREIALLVPPFGVETKAAFGWIAESRKGAPLTAPQPMQLQDLDRWEGVARVAENDFETPVFHQHPELAGGLEALHEAGAKIARMSGSGSTLFGVFERRPNLTAARWPAEMRLVSTRTATAVAAVRVLD